MKPLNMLKDKRFRYGTMSTAMMIVAIVIFVLVNLLADEFNQSRDLTAEQLYTLTTQTHRFLEELEMDITLTYLTRTGAETHMITQLFSEYSAVSPRITTEVRDPMLSPTFVHQFIADADGGIPDGSVIVQSAQGFRVVRPADMRTIGVNPQTWQQFIESIDAEREITQAIHALTLGDPTILYHITGSGENPLPEAFVAFLESENFVVRTHDAVLADIPETADALFITMPTRDWGSAKADRILAYLDEQEGRAFVSLGPSRERFPQLDRVLQAFGLRLGDYLVLEGNQARTFNNDPTWMMPMWELHEEITVPLMLQGFTGLLFMGPTGLDILDMRRNSTIIEPLFTTSSESLGLIIDTPADEAPEQVEGPFNLAVAVTDRTFLDTTRESRMVVVSTWSVLFEDVNTFIGGGNWAFIATSLNWLQDQPPGIWVPARRPPGSTPVMLSDAQVVTMTGVVMGVLPVSLFAIGIFIWFRRRHS
ncbi:MAG: GldG family protein [Defluviitaleaceae bacterium]|nr:GldG family protein [Defluviitaleaceae bacterium]